MPFTLFHVAAVLPLLRSRKTLFSATGLIIGSIAPDFEKFLRLGLHNRHSHTWTSILYFSCPVALGLAFLFHLVVRDPFIAHLPRSLYQRLARFQYFDWGQYFRQHYFVVVFSIMLGAATHLVWDSLTHGRDQLVEQYTWLRSYVHGIPVLLPVFSAFGVISSSIGALLIVWFVLRLPRNTAIAGSASTGYWLVAGITALGLLAGRVLLAASAIDAWGIGVTSLSAAMLGVVFASWRYPNRKVARQYLR